MVLAAVPMLRVCTCRPKSMEKCALLLPFFFFLALSALLPPARAAPCHPDDLRALWAFAGNLTGGALRVAWAGGGGAACCAWNGVVCDADGRVVALRLPGRGLAGPLPAVLASLERLEELDLSRNALSGDLSPVAAVAGLRAANLSSNLLDGALPDLAALPGLAAFDASNNSLSGALAPDLCAGAPALRVLDLSANRLGGALPSSANSTPPLCAATLRVLFLGSNAFSGALPAALFGLTGLQKLSLASNGLTGQVSSRIRELKNLTFLDLSVNRFSGHLPDVFGDLTSLENLAAHSNSFSGPLPPSMSLLPSLRVLDLRNNSLSGPIARVNFSGMPFLASIDLATNHLNGTLPVSLAGCRELKSLSLAKNRLTGQLPEDYIQLASLSMLSLSNNSLRNISGALRVLGGCKNLTTLILTKNFNGEELPGDGIGGFDGMEVLALGDCALRGRVPEWLTRCRKLEVLDLSWNQLVGTIPSWIGKFEYLSYLDLSNNSLVGEIPKSLTQLKSLVTARQSPGIAFTSMPLYVKHNKSTSGRQYNQLSNFPPSLFLNDNGLNGTIWPEFGNLRELHVLDLSNNVISGSIPDALSRMENLEVLDLSSNNLSGSIPSSLTKLTFLSKFTVAHNHLVGQIPNGGQFFTFSNSSFEGNPGLCRSSSCNLNLSREIPNDKEIEPAASIRNRKNKILGVAICIGLALAVFLAVILVNMSKREVSTIDYEDTEGSCHELYDCYSKPVLFFQNSAVKELTVSDLVRSTNNFDQASIIGCGGFGLVYKAYLPDGTKAAVKRLSGDCGQMEREFRAEVEALSQAQHKNLVTLRGYCRYGNDRLLIYSYMENGSLDYWLHERSDGGYMLKWESRLRIAQGSARGLAYLHKDCEPNIIHRDVKSSNILLNENFEACLADFGLARLIQPYDTHVTTDLVGTLGYIPPEYSQSVIATPKGDVFSFGVVLLELLTGKRPVDVSKTKGSRDLISWVLQMKSEKKEEQIFDRLLWSKAHEKQLLSVLETACKCISTDPRQRPLIEQVVTWLDSA
ncbi:phytosulfokine receptor 2 [Phragmites australis]|uniref:phytosulfokine receptor 2 n=1 Tax=Phragmites australis TaxID=29695 RepID=UPI002D784A24|nr:phytosulfokine receptor 2 [Phragmites australis]